MLNQNQTTRGGQDARTEWPDARSEIARLRIELERIQRLDAQAPARKHVWAEWLGWLGLSAGATLLVGAIALWAAMQGERKPSVATESVPPACPPTAIPTVAPSPLAAVPAKSELSPIPKRVPRSPHRIASPSTTRPHLDCDGRDPLCGLDFGTLEGTGKRPR
jgi:hypothetical protein